MKKTIRKEILKQRDEISPELRAAKDNLIKQRLFSLPEFIAAKTIFFYASFRSEVETLSMIKESLKLGKRVVLPKVQREGNRIRLYEIAEINELSLGYMGIPEPSFSNSRFLSLDEVDLIVIPGVAFDYSGNRLGYGGGYYDMLLAQRQKKMPIIALGYEEQLVDSISVEEYDVKVDVIVTDERIVRINLNVA